MQALRFDAAVDAIVENDKRYDPGAYFFLKDALDFTIKRTKGENDGEERHVSGQELLIGARDFALQEFGPMSATLLREWGIRACKDIGEMVFVLIEEGMFGRQDSDTKDDFRDLFDLEESLTAPFLPKSAAAAATPAATPSS